MDDGFDTPALRRGQALVAERRLHRDGLVALTLMHVAGKRLTLDELAPQLPGVGRAHLAKQLSQLEAFGLLADLQTRRRPGTQGRKEG